MQKRDSHQWLRKAKVRLAAVAAAVALGLTWTAASVHQAAPAKAEAGLTWTQAHVSPDGLTWTK